MARPRKLSPEQVEQVAIDRRKGMSWQKLREKYQCAINTLRKSLAEYSDEFAPIEHPRRNQLAARMSEAENEIRNIKATLETHLNINHSNPS